MTAENIITDSATNIFFLFLTYLNAAVSIPINPIKAIPLITVMKNAIPNPLKAGGILE